MQGIKEYSWIYALRMQDAAFANKDNSLPWPRNKEDLRYFVEMTANSNLICTQGTFEEIIRYKKNIFAERFERMWHIMPREESFSVDHPRFSTNKSIDSNKRTFIIGGRRAFETYNKPLFIHTNLILANLSDEIKRMDVSPDGGFENYEIFLVEKLSNTVVSITLKRKSSDEEH